MYIVFRISHMLHSIRPLWLLSIVLLAVSCATLHSTSSTQAGHQTPSQEEQRKYEYFYLEAVRLEQQGRYDEAFEMLQHCLSICPDASSALYKTANYYIILGRKDLALEALQQSADMEPDNYWYQQTLASYYQNNREYEKAIEVYEQMQQRFPKRNGELLPMLVGLYSHTQQYDKVIDALSKIEALTGKSEAVSMEKMRNYLMMGEKEAAFDEMEALATEYPDNSTYQVILAEVYMDYGRLPDAAPVLRKVLADEPDNGLAMLSMARYYKTAGDTIAHLAMTDSVMSSPNVDEGTKVELLLQLIREKADSTYVLHLFDLSLSLPQQSTHLGHLCVQYMLANNMPEERVRPVLLEMLETEPDHVQARLQLLSYAARRNDMDEIISICNTAIDYNPDILEFYYYKAVGLYQKDRVEEALATYQIAVEQVTPESDAEFVSDIFSAMGDLHHKLGHMEETYLCYDSALVYNPSNISALNNYAYYLSEENRELEKAERMSQRTLKEEPDNATYLDTYAWILYQMERYDEAQTYIDKALATDSVPSDVLYEHAGDIHYRLGNTEKALEYWRRALELQQEANAIDERLRRKIKQKRL